MAFITFEGGEGAGKTTQIARLRRRLAEAGASVLITHEPGGSADADALRSLLVTGDPGRWSATAEILLNYAARESHLVHTVRPALAGGATVLCDRFMDSTRAYQGLAGGGPLDLIDRLERDIVGDTRPDLTLVFDLDPVRGLERARTRGGGDRYERKGLAFHRRLRQAFLDIAAAEPARCRIVDAGQGEDEVAEAVWRQVAPVVAGG